MGAYNIADTVVRDRRTKWVMEQVGYLACGNAVEILHFSKPFTAQSSPNKQFPFVGKCRPNV